MERSNAPAARILKEGDTVVILGLQQDWWSVIGLALDILGFTLIAVELYLATRVALLRELVTNALREYNEVYRQEQLAVGPTAEVKDKAAFDAWLKRATSFFDKLEETVIIRCRDECRARLVWPMRFEIDPPWPDVISTGSKEWMKYPDFQRRFNFPPRFESAIAKVETAANRLRRWVPAAIGFVIVGFALQIIGSLPMNPS